MNLLKKLFGTKPKPILSEHNKLLELLEIHQKQNRDEDSYKNVLNELLNGDSYLLLPSVNKNLSSNEVTISDENTTLQLTSIFNLDGLKVLGAFTDESSLSNWAQKPTQYTALHSKVVLKLCEDNSIERIVINSGSSTLFFLERNRGNVESYVMEKETKIQVWTPKDPLDSQILNKLIEQFNRIDTIEEVYQYGQTKNNESSIVLGFKLSTISDNAIKATTHAVGIALENEKLNYPLDLYFIQEQGLYDIIRSIQGSLVYKK